MVEIIIAGIIIGLAIALGVELYKKAKESAPKFMAWCAEKGLKPTMESWIAFCKDTKGTVNMLDWIKGIIVMVILGVGVALPIMINTINSVNVSDPMTALVIGVLPVIFAVSILLALLR